MAEQSKHDERITTTIDTWLTSAEAIAFARYNQSKIDTSVFVPQVALRTDRLAILITAWVLTSLVLGFVPRLQVTANHVPFTLLGEELKTARILEREAEIARDLANSLYYRSTVLLLCGIVISFMGVAIFYFALPEESVAIRMQKTNLVDAVLFGKRVPLPAPYVGQPMVPGQFQASPYVGPPIVTGQPQASDSPIYKLAENSPDNFASVVKEMIAPPSFNNVLGEHLSRSLRPFGMLIFVESIAWFLLRQYRALIEDYKAFHRSYLRRVNVLVTFKMMQENLPMTPALQAFATALVAEDLSGRLKKDETTETLEGLKTIEPNLVTELFSKMLEKIPGLKTTKAEI